MESRAKFVLLNRHPGTGTSPRGTTHPLTGTSTGRPTMTSTRRQERITETLTGTTTETDTGTTTGPPIGMTTDPHTETTLDSPTGMTSGSQTGMTSGPLARTSEKLGLPCSMTLAEIGRGSGPGRRALLLKRTRITEEIE